MHQLLSEPKVRIEVDRTTKTYFSQWKSQHGPHYRKGIDLVLADVAKNGITSYITDATAATDVQSQEDLQYLQTTGTKILIAAGLKRFIIVVPPSAIAKMGANHLDRLAKATGVAHHMVGSVAEALALANVRQAA